MEKNQFWNVRIKNHRCYYFDDIITLQDFYFNNILMKIFWFMISHIKIWLVQKLGVLNRWIG